MAAVCILGQSKLFAQDALHQICHTNLKPLVRNWDRSENKLTPLKIWTVVVFVLLAATKSYSDSRFFVLLKIRTVVVFVLLAATGSCSDSRFFVPLNIRTVVVFVLLAAIGSCSDSRFFFTIDGLHKTPQSLKIGTVSLKSVGHSHRMRI